MSLQLQMEEIIVQGIHAEIAKKFLGFAQSFVPNGSGDSSVQYMVLVRELQTLCKADRDAFTSSFADWIEATDGGEPCPVDLEGGEEFIARLITLGAWISDRRNMGIQQKVSITEAAAALAATLQQQGVSLEILRVVPDGQLLAEILELAEQRIRM